MGGVNSCCVPRRERDCHENHSTPRPKGHRRNLSAAFNLSSVGEEKNGGQQGDHDVDVQSENLLNINTAREEEFMTLPGINRSTAQYMVDYRKQIGGFRKVEDLALVSGVGATKLNLIRHEICVICPKSGKPAGPVNNPSESRPEPKSFSPPNSKLNDGNKSFPSLSHPLPIVNINTANAVELATLKGVSPGIAENIIAYRTEYGRFTSVDDLANVKGIRELTLNAIRDQITCILVDAPSNGLTPGPQPDNRLYPDLSNGGAIVIAGTGDGPTNNPMKHDDNKITDSQWNLLKSWGPFLEKSVRKEVMPFSYKHRRRRVVRIGSWNLQQCSLEKIYNPGVREVICCTLLEQGIPDPDFAELSCILMFKMADEFGLLAIQELADQDALQELCNELNHPALANVKKWASNKGSWECLSSEATGRMYQSMEYNGFLYDTSQGIKLISSGLLQGSERKGFTRKPFYAIFRIRQLDCVIISVHLKAAGLRNEDVERTLREVDKIPNLLCAIQDYLPDEKDIIILGDFNIGPSAKEFDCLRDNGYKACISEDIPTNISGSNTAGTKNYDNIWISQQTQQVYTDQFRVVRNDLTSPWIPDGWKWGGTISDHCPIWAELYTGQDLDEGSFSKAPHGNVTFNSEKQCVGSP